MCPLHCTTCSWDSTTATTECMICEGGWYVASDGTCRREYRTLTDRLACLLSAVGFVSLSLHLFVGFHCVFKSTDLWDLDFFAVFVHNKILDPFPVQIYCPKWPKCNFIGLRFLYAHNEQIFRCIMSISMIFRVVPACWVGKCVSACATGCSTCNDGSLCSSCRTTGYAPSTVTPPYACGGNIFTLRFFIYHRPPTVQN